MKGIVGTETVQISQKAAAGVKDAYGNPISIQSFETITGVLVAPGAYTTTVELDGYETTKMMTFYLPLGTDIEFKNVIIYNSESYTLIAPPTQWKPPKGSPLKTKIIAIGQLTRLGEDYGMEN